METAVNHISQVRKMDGIKSWSLPAGETCPGSIGSDACKGCYAKSGCYRFSNVKAVRADNKEAWKCDSWVQTMVSALENERYFRWFDSGDMYSLNLAVKIYKVMRLTPWVNHWMPTRMYKFDVFKNIVDSMNALPNVVVRFSSDSIAGEYVKGLHGSVIIPSAETEDINLFICKASANGGKCSGCRACWSQDVPIIAYVQHGRAMKKVYSNLS